MNFLRAWVLVVAIAAWPWAGHAAGLGKIYVLSGLGQPLRVEIDLMVDKKEADDVSAKLASPFTYERSGLAWLSALGTSKVTVEKRANGDNFVRITTSQTVNEPFVELLLDLKWPSGSIQRQYTVLLDPPVQSSDRERAAAAAQTGTTAAPGQSAPQPVQTEVKQEAKPEVKAVPSTVEAQPVPMPAPEPTTQETLPAPLPREPAAAVKTEKIAAPPAETTPPTEPPAEAAPSTESGAPAKASESGASELGVTKRGDNLTKLAKKALPTGVTLEQMLVLLYRANPDAFDGKNMNRLRTGKVLRVPDAQEASSLSPKEARREIALQAVDWQTYRDNLANAAVKVAPKEEPAQSAGGKVTPKVEDKVAAGAEKPKEVLKLSKAEPTAEGKPSAAMKGPGKEEDAVAGGKQLNEATTRINKLEESLKNAQKLLELKNQGMADAQKQAKPEAGKTAGKPEAPSTPTPTPPAAPEVSAKNSGAATPPPSSPVQSAPATPAPSAPVVAKPVPKPPITVKQPSLMDMVMDNLAYIGGGAVALLLGVFGIRMLRRKRAVKPDASSTVAPLVSEAEPGAPVVGEEPKAFNPTATDGVGSAQNIAEEVDPVAEAEIFLAYGRDAQAEELLKEAMQATPGRLEIHSKLLQVYANRKDAKAFEAVARELQGATGGQGEIWMQAARLGYSIDPQNARYAAGRTEGSEPQVRTTQFPTTADPVTNLDFDVGVGAVGAGTQTDIDLSGDGLTQSQVIDLGDEKSAGLERSNVFDVGSAASSARTMDFRLDVPAAGNTQIAETVVDLDQANRQAANSGLDFDINSLSLSGHPEGKTEPTVAGSMPDLDLGDLNLDVGSPTTVIGGPMKDEHWQNVQTKFDLAKAYQEMGDKEGAREILREVVQEGDAEQRTAAQSLLTSLS
jgi:pilus assembly protein FimV